MVGNLDDSGSLSALSIFLVAAALQILDGFVDRIKKRGFACNEETQLRQEIKQLLKEASSLSTPSTFAQAAKLRRVAATKEKELIKKQEENSKEKKNSNDLYSRIVLVFKVLLYVGLIWKYWSIPVARVPQHLLQPFGRFMAWKSGDAATGLITVGIIPWLVLSSRVSKFLFQKLSRKKPQK